MDRFYVGPKVYYGNNSLEYLKKFKGKQVCIVTDNMMVKLGVTDRIKNLIEDATFEVFSDVEPNPSLETVKKGLALFLVHKPDVIIAIGGGSPIDTAKAILLFAQEADDYFLSKRPTFIAVPTTSGTGSEVTSYSVVTDTKNNVKIPLSDECMLPDIAILDEQLTKTVPPFVTADTGMDVLTHALEAYVTPKANDFTDIYAEKAIKYVFTYLLRAYRFGEDLEAREKLHVASCMAGIAFTNSALGINHSLAHQVGAKFHLSHGRSNAILLPYVVQFNGGLCDGTVETSKAAQKYAAVSKMLGLPCSTVEEGVVSLAAAIKFLNKEFNIPATFQECNIEERVYEKSISSIVEGALQDICTPGNPKEVREIDFIHLLQWAYKG